MSQRRRDLEAEVVRRVTVANAVAALDDRDRELIALRYGADLNMRDIGQLLDMRTNAIDVALHRCRERLRHALNISMMLPARRARSVVARPSPEPSS